MMNLDCQTGKLTNAMQTIAYGGMPESDCSGILCRKKASHALYRLDDSEEWLNHSVESVIVEFIAGKCREVTIHLLLSPGEIQSSASELMITRLLRCCLKAKEKAIGKPEHRFITSWGAVIVFFDVKLNAPSVRIHYS